MPKVIYFLLAFALSFPLSTREVFPKKKITLNVSGKDYAIFFAVTNYKDKRWPKLRNPIKDAEVLSKELKENFGFEVIIYPDPNKQKIKDVLEEWQQKEFKPSDQLFIFFSGHGTFDEFSQTGYFVPKEGKLEHHQTHFNLLEIGGAVNLIPCNHILLAVDACYSGTIIKEIRMKGTDLETSLTEQEIKDILAELRREKSRFILTSGGKERTPDGDKYSPFTKGILSAFQNTYMRGDSILTFYELLGKIQSVHPRPRYGRLNLEIGGDFIFSAKRVLEDEGISLDYPKMLIIPSGIYLMGNDDEKTSKPEHNVEISTFRLSETEVTVSQYMKFVAAVNAHYPEWNIPGTSRGVKPDLDIGYQNLGTALTGDNHPIVGISWDDAVAYCDWLTATKGRLYRLPSEAEWEYAAGGGYFEKTTWAGTSNFKRLTEQGWYDSNSKQKTHPVGRKKANIFGLMDMSGNITEWCQDTYFHGYLNGPNTNKPRTSNHTKLKILRGGHFNDSASDLTVTDRLGETRDMRIQYIGFRVAGEL